MTNAKRGKSDNKKKKSVPPPPCPKCGHEHTIKSGMVQGEQRWKCKSCAFQYTRIVPRGRPLWQKSLVVFLHSYGMSMHRIAQIFQVQPSTVLKWVRQYASDYPKTPESGAVSIMEMNDMRRHLKQAGKDSAILCIAIDDATFRKSLGITITQR